MTFIDLNNGRNYSVADLKRNWKQFREEDPENHAESFSAEFFEILLDTINRRNDMEVVGMTAKELSNYIIRIRKSIKEE